MHEIKLLNGIYSMRNKRKKNPQNQTEVAFRPPSGKNSNIDSFCLLKLKTHYRPQPQLHLQQSEADPSKNTWILKHFRAMCPFENPQVEQTAPRFPFPLPSSQLTLEEIVK